jgi:hypothetical protein
VSYSFFNIVHGSFWLIFRDRSGTVYAGTNEYRVPSVLRPLIKFIRPSNVGLWCISNKVYSLTKTMLVLIMMWIWIAPTEDSQYHESHDAIAGAVVWQTRKFPSEVFQMLLFLVLCPSRLCTWPLEIHGEHPCRSS